MTQRSSILAVAIAGLVTTQLGACSPVGSKGGVADPSASSPASVSNEPGEHAGAAGSGYSGGGTYRPPSSVPGVRSQSMVPGRPGRVFIFAGVDEKCARLPAPEVAVNRAPAKGEITFKPDQETKLAASVGGSCIGAKAVGTGVYYTARVGASGADSFSVTARLSSGETMTRDFTVEIAK